MRATRDDLVEHLVERHVPRVHLVAERELQHPARRRQRARRDDLHLAQVELVARDDNRAVALAEGRAVRQEDIAVGDRRIGAGGERRHLEPPLERPFVQRLDVGDDGLQIETALVDPIRLERPDHERVVGIRTVSDPDRHGGHVTLTM
jgi:hypothetical protein